MRAAPNDQVAPIFVVVHRTAVCTDVVRRLCDCCPWSPACHTGDMAGNTGPTALVTGAAGFIGREVVQVLVARGCQVFGLARSVVSARPASPRWRDRRYGWRSSVAPSTISRNNPELPRAHIRRTRDRCRAGVSVEYTKRARRNGRCVCDPRSRQGSLQLQGGIHMKNSKTHEPQITSKILRIACVTALGMAFTPFAPASSSRAECDAAACTRRPRSASAESGFPRRSRCRHTELRLPAFAHSRAR
jgi:hypothetical protein